jgi:hypothetical protein
MPSTDGHTYDQEELPRPDPNFKFGVTSPYTSNGTGTAFFDTGETLPSAVDPLDPASGGPFRRKDSTVSGAGSDSGSSNTNIGRGPSHPPLNGQSRKRNETLRPSTADTNNTGRTPIQSDDGGKPVASPVNGHPNVAEARMRRLLHELDSIGLTDEMTIGRNSHDIDGWTASSSVGHVVSPPPPQLAIQKNGPPMKYRSEDIQRLQQMGQARQWQQQQQHYQNAPLPGPGMRAPYGQNPQMIRGYPVDASETAYHEPADAVYYGRPVPTANARVYSNLRMAPPAPRGMSPPQQMQQGSYHPMQQNRMPNSAAFPIPPRTMTPTLQQEMQQRQYQQQQQMDSPTSRALRTPPTAGNDPPVSYYNATGGRGSNPLNRSRFGSDNNLRERYMNSGPQQSPSMSGSQLSQVGLSPISPASTVPAMTLSSSGSRTNSIGSGALETPIDGNGPSVANQTAQTSNLESIKEKPSAIDVVVTPTDNHVDKTEPSPAPTKRRGSLDSGLTLKTTSLDSPKEKGAKSPSSGRLTSPTANHNPFLAGGLSGGLMFGGLALTVNSKERGNPPPYRMHPPPTSSGTVSGRSNSLRAGSIGGRSDGSGSSFGDGIHKASPAVALATGFVKEGANVLSTAAPHMTKAEKAAEKARQKAEKAAQKAEEARMKVEEEKDAKKNEAELKKKRKEEKIIKRLQVNDISLYGSPGMVRLDA